MIRDPLAEIEIHAGAVPRLQPRRHLLFCQGDSSDFIYIVRGGSVILYEILEDGRKQVMKFAGPGSVLGFMPPSASHMTYTGECLTTVVLSVISRSRFIDVLRDRSELAIWWAGVLAQDIEASFRRLTSIGRNSARERIAQLLVELACSSAPKIRHGECDRAILLLPVTRQQIADAVGLSSEHVSRVFRGFKDDGLIAADQSRIRILDLQHLAEVAGTDLELDIPPRRAVGDLSFGVTPSALKPKARGGPWSAASETRP